MTWTRCLVSLFLGLAAFPATLFAQPTPPEPKQYRPLPYQGSLAEIYKEKMLGLNADGLQGLIKELQNNPSLAELAKKLASSSKDGKSIDPALLDKLRKNGDGSPKQFDVEKLKELQQTLEKWKGKQANPAKEADVHGKAAEGTAPKGDHPDALDKPAKWLADKISHSSLPKDYPAFGKFKDDVLAGKWASQGDKGLSGIGLEDILSRWLSKPSATDSPSLDMSKAGPLPIPGGGALPELPTAPLVPDLAGGLGNAVGGFGDVAKAGSGSALLQVLLIGAVFLATAIAVWTFWGPARRKAPQVAVAALGPWPVDPARITTREQLVQAFEYLALLLLGNRIRSANHMTIARGLASSREKSEPAEHLAALYEKARYDLADHQLPPADLSAASRDLLVLAGNRALVSGER